MFGSVNPRAAPESARLKGMYSCPCCGYKTLPGRGDYDLCPVCWWEDDGAEPWDSDGPNGRALIEAQLEYLTERRPYRQRPGKVRAPRKKEARDPGWQPLERTAELLERTERSRLERERFYEAENRRIAQEIADDPEGPFKGYNAAVETLRKQAPDLSHREIRTQFQHISDEHDMPWSDAHLEILSRLMSDEHYYRDHPIRAIWWLIRYPGPRTYRRRWAEVRTGTISFAG